MILASNKFQEKSCSPRHQSALPQSSWVVCWINLIGNSKAGKFTWRWNGSLGQPLILDLIASAWRRCVINDLSSLEMWLAWWSYMEKWGRDACIRRGTTNRSNTVDMSYDIISFPIFYEKIVWLIYFWIHLPTVATACEMTTIILERESVDNTERRVCILNVAQQPFGNTARAKRF